MPYILPSLPRLIKIVRILLFSLIRRWILPLILICVEPRLVLSAIVVFSLSLISLILAPSSLELIASLELVVLPLLVSPLELISSLLVATLERIVLRGAGLRFFWLRWRWWCGIEERIVDLSWLLGFWLTLCGLLEFYQ